MIKKGDKGIEVKNWQEFLNNYLDHKTGYIPLIIDSDFGDKTKSATGLFQYTQGLKNDGIVGKNTIAKAVELGYKPTNINTKIMRPIDTIILHITANGNGLTGDALRESIKAGHLARGFSDIGYHWIVDKEGTLIKGRDESIIGAHVEGHNTGSVGIAYDGRGDDHTPYAVYGHYMTEPQKIAFEKLVKEKMTEFNIDFSHVHGHNFYNKGKACPCFNVEKDKVFQEFLNS